jgi:hypothetical protein
MRLWENTMGTGELPFASTADKINNERSTEYEYNGNNQLERWPLTCCDSSFCWEIARAEHGM